MRQISLAILTFAVTFWAASAEAQTAVWGMGTSGGGAGVARSLACERAIDDANSNCQNMGCQEGCARLLPCDCACMLDDFGCICNVFGELCELDEVPDDPSDPPRDPLGCDPEFQSCLN